MAEDQNECIELINFGKFSLMLLDECLLDVVGHQLVA